jgi:hypothetical protein
MPPSIAHLQDADGPVNPNWSETRGLGDRGVTLCGYTLKRTNYVWSPLPAAYPEHLVGWTICLACVLRALT